MTNNEDLMVGLVAAALALLIAWRIVRGVRAGRLPVYRTYIERDEDGAKFAALLVLHVVSMLVAGAVAADLLFGLNLRGR
ncbi:MAG: hypothetical protein WKF52_08445 [Sphingomicrobium sp.]